MTDSPQDSDTGHTHNGRTADGGTRDGRTQPRVDVTVVDLPDPTSSRGRPDDVGAISGDAAVTGVHEFTEAALAAADTNDVAGSLHTLAHAAIHLVPCRWAAIAVLDERLTVPARIWTSTDPVMFDDVMQVALDAGTSPGWDAARHGGVRSCPDLATETRYGTWGGQMHTRTPVRSMAAAAFALYDDGHPGGVLNVYADHARAFDDTALTRLRLLADHCALVVNRARSENRADTLETALTSSRIIGAAVGILIERHRLTYDQAFDRLKTASQNGNRKLRDVAESLLHTGALPTEPDAR